MELKFPDGTVKEFEDGATVKDVAASISMSLAKKAVCGKLDGKLVDLNQKLSDGSIEIVAKDSDDGRIALWHTAAVVLAAALHDLYPNVKFGEGGVTEHGFYFDTDKEDGQVGEADFEKLTKKMEEIVKAKEKIEFVEYDLDEALKLVENDEYQTEIVKENAEDGKVYGHKLLNHVDFTSPVSLEDAGKVKVFKVLSVAGAYWKGASSNPAVK